MALVPLYGVIGNPIGHSLSPVMHNAAFAATDQAACFNAFQVKDLELEAAIAGVRALGIAGLSVTLPHKSKIMEYLDEIDDQAFKIAAVNTVVNRQGRLCGYNTDAAGALAALQAKIKLSGRRVLILGAGGAARALVYGVAEAGGRVAIVNRSAKRGAALAQEFGAQYLAASEIEDFQAEVLVNTTSLGMAPAIEQMPCPATLIKPSMVVMDIVYNPLKTKLLEAAEKCGAVTIDGLEMFIGQGALQFEMWTGQKAPLKVMRQAVLNALGDDVFLKSYGMAK